MKTLAEENAEVVDSLDAFELYALPHLRKMCVAYSKDPQEAESELKNRIDHIRIFLDARSCYTMQRTDA